MDRNRQILAKLDRLDKKLIFELDRNARQPISKISKTLKLGRDLVGYRLERLTREGVLNSTTAFIDPYKLGLSVYKTYLKLESSLTELQKLIKFLRGHPNVYWLAECYGRWDVIFSCLASNPSSYDGLLEKLLSPFSHFIRSYTFAIAIDVWIFPRGYLARTATEERHYGSESIPVPTDDLDRKILSTLAQNARFSATEIAEYCRSTPVVIARRIDRLQKQGVLVGFRTQINLNRLGMQLFKVQIIPKLGQHGRFEELHTYCKLQPKITCLIKHIGEFKIELEVEAESIDDLHSIIDDLRNSFSDYIVSMEHVLIRKDHHHEINLLRLRQNGDSSRCP